jgi:Protein of unknown function (DUF1566)
MKNKIILIINLIFISAVLGFSILPVLGQSQITTIVDTGQDKFYNDSSTISEPMEEEAFYGQDANFSGNQPSYTLSADGLTVYDNNTGLTWQQSNSDNKLSYSQALDYVGTMNAQNYAGFSDWRLPTIKQLYSLIDFRGTDPPPEGLGTDGLKPFIDENYFEFEYGDTNAGERIIDAQWASSTLYVANNNLLFGVNFADGRIKGYGLSMFGSAKTFCVRLVRGNESYGTNDFTDNSDGTISDSATGLMWTQSDSEEGMTWESALEWAQLKNDQNYQGYSDWRLPDAKELQALVDYTRAPDTTGSAAIDPLFSTTAITNMAGQADYPFFWTGTTHLSSNGDVGRAVYVAFGRGLGLDNGTVVDVHGAGCQRSDPKYGLEADYPTSGNGPQGDVSRVFNFVRLVRDAGTYRELFAHVADGGLNGNYFRSYIILVNGQNQAVEGSLKFYDSEGEISRLSIDGENGLEFPFSIPARSSKILRTDGISDPVYVGWAAAITDAPISGMLQYSLETSAGKPLSEAGIQASPLAQELTASVQKNRATGLDTGMAIVNPAAKASIITILVKDQSEETVISEEIELEPGQHLSMFLSQLGELPDSFTGTILIDADSPIAATLIRTIDGLHSSSLPFSQVKN